MSVELFKKDIEHWINNWVSVHNEQLGTIPCPFAKQAMLRDKIAWRVADSPDQLEIILYALMEEGMPNEVLAIGIDPQKITPEELSSITKKANDVWLMPCGLVALEDHPHDIEVVNGATMNQGTWALVLLQESSKLKAASDILRKQGYYDRWTQEQLDDVVNWR